MVLSPTYFGITLCLVASVRSQTDAVSQIHSMVQQIDTMVAIINDEVDRLQNGTNLSQISKIVRHDNPASVIKSESGVYNIDNIPDTVRKTVRDDIYNASVEVSGVIKTLEFSEEKAKLAKLAADLRAQSYKSNSRYKRDTVPKKIQVDVFFEGLCPDSKLFIKQHLAPLFPAFENHINLTLVPFGKASSTQSGFICQHGPSECKSNVRMACAYYQLPPGRQQVQFTDCFMTGPSQPGRLQICSNEVGLDADFVESCTQNELGYNLQIENERQTLRYTPGPRFVPTVVINKSYDDMIQNKIESGAFLSVLCHFLPTVQACNSSK